MKAAHLGWFFIDARLDPVYLFSEKIYGLTSSLEGAYIRVSPTRPSEALAKEGDGN